MKTFLKLVAILIININLFANDFDLAMEEYNKSNYTEKKHFKEREQEAMKSCRKCNDFN